MAGIKINETKMISVDLIHPNEYNPNTQSDHTFNRLVEEIKEDGFDHPLQVVPCNCDKISGPHFKIIGGEHRWNAAKVLGMDEIPCTVYENWDEEAQKLKTVRRNLLSGHLDDAKFTRMVAELRSANSMSDQELSDALGFENEAEFAAHIISDIAAEKADEKEWLKEMIEQSKPELDAVDSMSDVLHNIFSKYGDTVPQSFMFFAYKGKTHLMVLMNDELFKLSEVAVEHLKATGMNINDFMREAMVKQMDSE